MAKPAEAQALPDAVRACVTNPDGSSDVHLLRTGRTDDDATTWLRVVGSGVCGTDVQLAAGQLRAPTVLGHHVVGELVAVDPAIASRLGVAAGDRVALEEYLPCGQCRWCLAGEYRFCRDADLWSGGRRIGLIPVGESPGLWGGNAEYLRVPSNAILVPLPAGLSWDMAQWTLPFANALDWVLEAGGLSSGDRVLILGSGYHGLAITAAALHGRAAQVVVCDRREERLEAAATLGATTVLLDGSHDGALIAGAMERQTADLVVDATGAAAASLDHAWQFAALNGRIVLTAAKEPRLITIDSLDLIRRRLTIRAVRGRARRWVDRAIEIMAAGGSGLERASIASIALEDVGKTLQDLGTGRGPTSPHVVVHPNGRPQPSG